MSRFWKTSLCWFAVLMLCWLAANLAGAVRPMGLKPFRIAGFPFTVASWGSGVEKSFDWDALAGNAIIALGTSGLLAWLCAAAVTRKRRRKIAS